MAGGNQSLGKWGEKTAEEFLIERGLVLVAKNVRTGFGEIDLVMMDSEVVVFVEVKTRRSRAFGRPEEAITQSKFRHMVSAAESFMQSWRDPRAEWRLDVVAIYDAQGRGEPEIKHIPNVQF